MQCTPALLPLLCGGVVIGGAGSGDISGGGIIGDGGGGDAIVSGGASG